MTPNPNDTATPEMPAPRTDLDFDYFRKRLMEERALAQHAVSGTESQDDDGGANTGMNDTGTNRAELSGGADNHPADLATDLQLREQDAALVVNAQGILEQIDRALQKLDEGTYGLSDRSHQPIPKERLEALPYAVFTADEQSIVEMS